MFEPEYDPQGPGVNLIELAAIALFAFIVIGSIIASCGG